MLVIGKLVVTLKRWSFRPTLAVVIGRFCRVEVYNVNWMPVARRPAASFLSATEQLVVLVGMPPGGCHLSWRGSGREVR